MSCMRSGYRFLILLVVLVFLPSLSANAQLPNQYKKWLDEDVHWIISPQEHAQFLNLSDDAQRKQFIVAFWERRNPTPGAPENKFKEEHYRRIAYANMHFAYETKRQETVPGWKTDRGRIYILYGNPDTIDSHPSGKYELASGVRASTDPFEIWHYKLIEGIGSNLSVRFVDKCHCGDYQQRDEIEKDQDPRSPPEN